MVWREVGHHFPSFQGLPYLPSSGPETLALLAHLMCPNGQEPLCPSDLKSHLLEVTQLDLQRPSRIFLELGQSELGPPSPLRPPLPPSLEEQEEVM